MTPEEAYATSLCTIAALLGPLCDLSLFSVDSNADFMKGLVLFLPPPKPHLSVRTQADCVFAVGAMTPPLMLCLCLWGTNNRLCYQMYF